MRKMSIYEPVKLDLLELEANWVENSQIMVLKARSDGEK